MSAPSPLADDATRERCALCGREIVRAGLAGGGHVTLDPLELDPLEGDVEPTRGVVLLDAAGRAHQYRARRASDARHTRHCCAQGAGQRGREAA